MAKRFIFREAPRQLTTFAGHRPVTASNPVLLDTKAVDRLVRKFAEPSADQIKKAKETWKRLAPKEAKGLIK